MRIPVSWLSDYVAIEMPLEELASRLSVASAEVEGIERIGLAPDPANDLLRVGRVLELAAHPNADRLRIARVELGEGAPRSIVCGAMNFEAGASVAVALPGAVLADGARLERRTVRGELSDGMILAEDELGLGADHSGIMLLAEAEPGTPLADVLLLSDTVLILEATGNRPDLQSVYGVAREIAALYGQPLAPMPGGAVGATAAERRLAIAVDEPGRCPRYIGRLLEGVTVSPSPQWLRFRLQAAGVRPISNVVDVTNYVMLALGSPLHAFDFATLHGGEIVVRLAGSGERLTTLDGVVRELDGDDLVIADRDRAIALAGIMGGAETEIAADTRAVLLEAANFEPTTIFRSSERHRLRSEASGRWEKGVDPRLAEAAAELASGMLLELAGGHASAAADVHAPLPELPRVAFRPARADALIGLETPAERQYALLEALGFERSGEAVVVPSWRARDVTREVDVIEEIARFRLDDVPFTLPARREMYGSLRREQRLRRRLEDALVGLGFAEVYTPSLRPDGETPWILPDPISVELSALRTSLLPSLVEAAQRNLDAGARGIALFEIARVYLPGGELPEERLRLGAIAESGFLAIKVALESIHAALKGEPPSLERAAAPLLHPGKSARGASGLIGELHPSLLEGMWGAFELDLADLFALVTDPVVYLDVISYPAVRQDIALVVDEQVPVGELLAVAREAAGEELRELRVFDVYRGGQVEPGRKSVALALSYQSAVRTLSEEDANRLRDRIVALAGERVGARLRSA